MACAVGLEVFNIITENDLPANAARMGSILKSDLEDLADRHPIIGEVRGKGLLLAIELVENPKTREPFPAGHNAGQLLTDIAYDEGLIIYPRRPINGLLGDHVLVAPPLIITAEEVSELLKRLDRSLSRLMSTIKTSVQR
jgi:adenosylmethionine-8-amino-7-oxononanoate aminotransferase